LIYSRIPASLPSRRRAETPAGFTIASPVRDLWSRPFHEFADQSIRYSAWSRAYYDLQRSRGKDHHAALRALAYKWIRIIFRCWKDNKPYDEATYIDSLRRRGSSVIENIDDKKID
jgi:hypothetical protein